MNACVCVCVCVCECVCVCVPVNSQPPRFLTGTGLVTSTGESWKRQRALVGPAFRRDILEETAGVAKRAVDRLSLRLEAKRGKGEPVELAEEFRVMTLQVIDIMSVLAKCDHA